MGPSIKALNVNSNFELEALIKGEAIIPSKNAINGLAAENDLETLLLSYYEELEPSTVAVTVLMSKNGSWFHEMADSVKKIKEFFF